MERMSINYAGLELQNPIVVSSSGLTNTPDRVKKLEKAGAGAVVLKSLFEDQINLLMDQFNEYNEYPEAFDYLRSYSETFSISEYTNLIKGCKAVCEIPIIASIHCFSNGGWTSYARMLEEAGADAIELNISILNTRKAPVNVESIHLDILKSVKSVVSIPVILKIGSNYPNLVSLVEQLHANGAAAIVLFNRFYQPDINIIKESFTAGNVFSTQQDLSNTIRWISIVSGVLPQVNLAASNGVHEWEDAVKVLLAGATVVQVCSAIYESGDIIISQMITCIEEWMNQKRYRQIDEFRGKLNYKRIPDPSMFERTQFMKYFGEKK